VRERRNPLQLKIKRKGSLDSPPKIVGGSLGMTIIGGCMIYWIFLILAIVFEVMGTTSMKLAYGFTKLVPSLLVFVFYAAALGLLVLSLKKIDVSVSYAIWSGLGTALIAVIGFVWFREPVSALRIGSLVLIIAGVVGLKLSAAQ
jgi:small multidrug resistance pump